jgi:hypothetical protein
LASVIHSRGAGKSPEDDDPEPRRWEWAAIATGVELARGSTALLVLRLLGLVAILIAVTATGLYFSSIFGLVLLGGALLAMALFRRRKP